MNHASLFSGIGGFDLAAEWMGWNNLFHCEINPFGQKILKHYWPNAKCYEDIKTTDFTIYRGIVDILSGGFPCQPFSVAGKRKGTEDDRYLWPEMLRAIDEIRPTWVVGENVAGLVSMVQPEAYKTHVESQADFFGEVDEEIVSEYQQYVVETVCADLERIGYSVQPIVIPACAVGAPHRRDRIWFIANRADTGTEDMRRSEKCFYGSKVVANAHGIGRKERGTKGNSDDKKETIRADIHQQFIGASTEQPFTDTYDDGSYVSKNGQSSFKRNDGNAARENDVIKSQGCSCTPNVAYTNPTRPQTKCKSKCTIPGERKNEIRYINQYSGDDRGTLSTTGWENFPTQPPVCSGNDGVPFGLDGITFPQWRTESIKAYGNAVVPEVVFEIFKGIEQWRYTQK
ncbi:DNA (cytosine-5-)-methyltransferase [Sphingobacterium alkalisoli]|uniref:Cytosine-specific methyltransferase n=1 Tax=Sphingobacterium alkalisoli TaxID=1874115 RepID=A0A4U0GUM0_9SPHI|nr:DNA (cytosine-5-)-methyltransferase [Sphingobacterium alkalisoli]TJY62713.1 DNA (cytosine-5-)-methyltransferase [Sphingobacterium alkalisoli]GGH28379.1 hypothetical protein GCM10011418_39000 [Sphingobacterium alkalisoli]